MHKGPKNPNWGASCVVVGWVGTNFWIWGFSAIDVWKNYIPWKKKLILKGNQIEWIKNTSQVCQYVSYTADVFY